MVSIILDGMPYITTVESKHTYTYVSNSVEGKYTYNHAYNSTCWALQNPGCVTTDDLRSRAMPEQSWLPRPLTTHYGSAEVGESEILRVPTEPWVTGDMPREDRVHLRIFVAGAKMKKVKDGLVL